MGKGILRLRLDLKGFNNEFIKSNIHIQEVSYNEIPIFLETKKSILNSKVYSIRLIDYIIDKVICNKYYLYYFEGNLIGICGIKYRKEKAFFFDFGIIPRFRGNGLSRLCLLKMIKRLKAVGIKQLDLKVRIENYKAINLYKSLGFIEV